MKGLILKTITETAADAVPEYSRYYIDVTLSDDLADRLTDAQVEELQTAMNDAGTKVMKTFGLHHAYTTALEGN